MTDAQMKNEVRQQYVDRQAAREAARLAQRQAETEAAIADTTVETRMTAEEGVAFLRAGGEREDAA